MSHHIARICHMPAYVTSPAYVTLPAYVTCPQMSHQPFGWKMLMTTFQFTVRYKWSERKASVLCTCFKIHYSFSMQKQKMIEMKSVYMSGNVYSTFIPGGTSLSDPRGSSQGKINSFFFSAANTSNGSKIYPQAPNGSK